MQVFDTPEAISYVQLCARKGALKLEILGMRRRGRSAYAICKEVYGLRGTRQSVLRQMEALVEKAIKEKEVTTCSSTVPSDPSPR